MLGNNLSWALLFTSSAIIGAAYLYRARPGVAIGAAIAVSLLSGTWVSFSVFSVPLGVRSAIAAVFLVGFCVHRQGRFSFSWHWLDSVVVGILLVGVASEWFHEGVGFGVLPRVYGEWLVPYFAGRFMSMRRYSIGLISPWFAGVSFVIGVCAIFESITYINVWEFLFAPVDDLVARISRPRLDLFYRAIGPTRQPIFLGVILMLLLPWSVALISRNDSWTWFVFGWLCFVSALFGIVATFSRGPLVATAMAAVFAALIALPRIRLWIVGSMVFGALAVAFFWDPIISIFEMSTEGTRTGQVVVVDGEAKVHNATRNRLLIWEVYGPLVLRGGLLGYGTEAVSSFPPEIPGLPASARDRETLGIVDNSYLLVGLRHGLLGVSLLVVLLVGSIITAVQLRRSAGIVLYPSGPAFLTAMASMLAGVSVEIMTVFFSYDFAFWVLFHCGVVAGLASLRSDMVRGVNREETAVT